MSDEIKISLVSDVRPIFSKGTYTLKAESNITLMKPGKVDNYNYNTVKSLVIDPDYRVMNDSMVQSVFPPRGGKGAFSCRIPFIVFRDRSLPWRIKPAFDDQSNILNPWFVLLVLPEGSGESLSDGKLTIPKDAFMKNIPKYSDLSYLTHVRKVEIENKVTDEENMTDVFSVMMGNRFIKGGINSAYLISIIGIENVIQGKSKIPGDEITVDCMYNWGFESVDENYGIEQFMKNVSVDVLRPQEKTNPNVIDDPMNLGYIPIRHYLINGDKTVSWYRGPFVPDRITPTDDPPVSFAVEKVSYDKRLSMLDVSYSSAWQLGRLLALSDTKYASQLIKDNRINQNNQNSHLIGRKIKNANRFDNLNIMLSDLSDKLVESPQKSGKVNYAFKTGDKQTDPSNNELKKTIKERIDRRSNEIKGLGLIEYSELVREKISRWSAFYDVPFEWLFPNVDLIPDDSIRLFMIDPNWQRSFIDGAISLGRYSTQKREDRKEPDKQLVNAAILSGHKHRKKKLQIMRGMEPKVEYESFAPDSFGLEHEDEDYVMSGILINSKFVADNPGVEIHLYREDDYENELEIVRMERIKTSMLLCIAKGKIRKVVLDMPAEGLHYGCTDMIDDEVKIQLRYLDSGIAFDETMSLSFFHEDENGNKLPYDKGRIDFEECRKKLEALLLAKTNSSMYSNSSITSAEIALEFTVSRYEGVIDFGEQLFDGTT